MDQSDFPVPSPRDDTNPDLRPIKGSARHHQLVEMYRQIHQNGLPEQGITSDRLFVGASLLPHIHKIRDLTHLYQAESVMDYGSGKALLYKEHNLKLSNGIIINNIQEFWNIQKISAYDPAVPGLDILPNEVFDAVISTDALEHCEEADVDWILDEIFAHARKFVFANVASYLAAKILPNGENAHATVRAPDWWGLKFMRAAKRRGGCDFYLEVDRKRPKDKHPIKTIYSRVSLKR